MVFAFGQVVISLLLLFSGLLGLALARVELAKGCALTMHLGPFFFEEKIIKKLGTSANTFFGVFWCEK